MRFWASSSCHLRSIRSALFAAASLLSACSASQSPLSHSFLPTPSLVGTKAGDNVAHNANWISSEVPRAAKKHGLIFVSDAGASVIDIFSRAKPTKIIGQIVSLLGSPEYLVLDTHEDLFVANTGVNDILEFSPPYKRVAATYQLGQTGTNGLMIGGDGLLYASGAPDQQIVEYRLGHPNSPHIIYLPVGPLGMALDSRGNLFAGFNGSETAGVFELSEGSKLAQGARDPTNLLIPLEAYAGDIAFNRNGDLVVEDAGAGVINVYRPGTKKPLRSIGGFQYPVTMQFDPEKRKLYVGDFVANDVKIFDYATGALLTTLTGFTNAWGVTVSAPSDGPK